MDLYVADFAGFVNHEQGTLWHAALVTHAIEVGDLALRIEVRQQGKRHAILLGPGIERISPVHANAGNQGIMLVEPPQIGLAGGHLDGTGGAKSKGEEGEDDVFLAAVVAQGERFSLGSGKREVGRFVTNSERFGLGQALGAHRFNLHPAPRPDGTSSACRIPGNNPSIA